MFLIPASTGDEGYMLSHGYTTDVVAAWCDTGLLTSELPLRMSGTHDSFSKILWSCI